MALLQRLIDTFMSEAKVMVGQADWAAGPRFLREGQQRYLQTLAISGETAPIRLMIDTYPKFSGREFTICLVHQEAGVEFVRCEYGTAVFHVNAPPLPDGVTFGRVDGPHIHSWRLNRQLFDSNRVPNQLLWAEKIPANVKGFPNTFRWLCGEHRIECHRDIPDLPGDLLL